MDTTNDHPDIEKLPLEIDGSPIRESIREIFRNPVNGTPDNISKAGCLALAKQGAIVWNVWRLRFPVFPFSNTYPLQCKNNADFSLQNFENILRDLRGFNFGLGAFFDQSKWGVLTKFDGAQWGDNSSFFGSVWGDYCSFEDAQWGEFCRFDGASWGQEARFKSARWGRYCMFNGARWCGFTWFSNAEFGGYLVFKNCFFEHGAVFDFSRFGANIRFAGSIFGGHLRFTSSDGVETFSSIDFGGCEFKGDVDFGGRRFLGETNFGTADRSGGDICISRDNNGLIVYQENSRFPRFDQVSFGTRFVIFHKTPNFHGCELHQDTSFEGAKFPTPSGSEEAARSYRTLKLAFSKQQAVREEQRFFRLEMVEETMGYRNKSKQALQQFKFLTVLREGFTWGLYMAYSGLSDYGLSVARPLVLLVVAWLVFASIYGSYSSGQSVCMMWQAGCDLQTDWLSFSLQQSLPLHGFEKLEHTIKGVAVGWLFLHKTISLAALFLIGLALRNLFKLK